MKLVSEVYAAHLKPCEHPLKVNGAIQCSAAPVNATIRSLVHFDDFGLWQPLHQDDGACRRLRQHGVRDHQDHFSLRRLHEDRSPGPHYNPLSKRLLNVVPVDCGAQEKCRHKLASMPRWLSSAKVETVRKLLAEDPAMLLRESLGISADGSEKVRKL